MKVHGPEAFVAYWTRLDDWRDASKYPTPDAARQAFGREFSRRRPGFADELAAWIEGLSDKERSELWVDEAAGVSRPTWGFAELLGISKIRHGPRLPQTIRYEGREWHAAPVAIDSVSLVFDLNENIKDQLARAGAILRDWQRARVEAGRIPGPPRARHDDDLLPLYLRTFDARAAGASWGEIAEGLQTERGVDERTVKHWHQAAERYIGGGYRELLAETRSGKRTGE